MSLSRVYVGNLPLDVRERDLEDLFAKASEAARAGQCPQRASERWLQPSASVPLGGDSLMCVLFDAPCSPQFGRYRYIDVKNQGRPPAFAFIEYGALVQPGQRGS